MATTIITNGRTTTIYYNGIKSQHKTAFIKKLTVNDLLLMLEEGKTIES